MLSKPELDRLCDELGISAEARRVIDDVRSSPPSRRVQGAAGNVCVQFQSHKMGCTIQAESHRVELPFVYEVEFDPNILEYWDQPPQIKLLYESKSGKQVGVLTTPDYFVIAKDWIGWVECKPEDQLLILAEDMPHRFVRDGNRWRCPPGEAHAAKFGLFFRIYSSAEINWILQRNLIFLEDYLQGHSIILDENMVASTISEVMEHQGVMLDELLSLENITSDTVYTMIVRGQLYVDLKSYTLAEPESVPVFSDQDTAKAYSTAITVTQKMENPFVIIEVGAPIIWDGQEWIVTNIGITETALIQTDGTHVEIPQILFDEYVKTGKISSPGNSRILDTNPYVAEMMAQASPRDFEVANKRLEIIKPYLMGSSRENAPATRTIRRHKKNWENAENDYGCGYIGLLQLYRASGNRKSKLPAETKDEMLNVIKTKYETIKHQNMRAVFGALQIACEEKGLIVPSYKTFVAAVHKRPQYEQTKAREGKRAAYKEEPIILELTMTTPRHGDLPWEVCHLDHTELDIELRSSRTNRILGKAWYTIMTDANTRQLPAVTISFDPPSYRSCMAVIRECVRLHSRLPKIIVVDGGKDFQSTYFETFLARYGIHKKTRPSAQPKYGTVCERLFGTTNTQFIHNLLGNSQITKNIRQVTKAVNPKNHAVWTLPALYARLCEWSYEVYDTTDHPALGQTPREAHMMGIKLGGERSHKLIPYDDAFLMSTLPTTVKGTAKINPQSGVKINYINYWSNTFSDPDLAQVSVPVRYEPYNAGIAFAFVKKRWVKCISEYYRVFAGKTQKETQLATAILHTQNKLHNKKFTVTSRKLADFLGSTEAEETLLIQRLKDQEYKEILRSRGLWVDEEPETFDQDIAPNPDETTDSPTEDSDEDYTNFDTYKDF